MNQNSVRMAKWDNAKFILIFFVVTGHLINNIGFQSTFLKWIWVFAYLFDMPAFLFLSGLFSKRTVDEHRYDRMFSYLYLYLAMSFFRFIVYSIVNGKASSINLFSESGVAWYALVLFFCYLATCCVKSFKRSYVLIFAILLGMMAGYDNNLGSFLAGMRFFTFFPFFLVGFYMPVDRLLAWIDRKAVKITSACILLLALLLCYFCLDQLFSIKTFLKGKASYESMGMLPYGGIYRGCYYIVAFLLIFCFLAVVPNTRCVISSWGQRTVQVYAVHFPILYILMNGLHFQEFLIALWPAHYGLLVPVCAFVLTVLLSLKIWSPFFGWLMNPGGKVNRKNINGQ